MGYSYEIVVYKGSAMAEIKMDRITEAIIDDLLEIVAAFWFSGEQGAPEQEVYEEGIFNEMRLYKALGKEDARTVLGIFRRWTEVVKVCQTLRQHHKKAGRG